MGFCDARLEKRWLFGGAQEEMAGLFEASWETWSFQLHVSRSRNMLVPQFE